MNATLLSLPVQLQITLVAGFIAYMISTMGRGLDHKAHEFLLLVLVFGFPATLLAMPLGGWFATNAVKINMVPYVILSQAVFAILLAMIISAFWRAKGRDLFSQLMSAMGIYKDDHESSVWRSISNAKVTHQAVQIYTHSGLIYESFYGAIKAETPIDAPIINDDGIALYVTNVWEEGTAEEISPIHDQATNTWKLRFIPRDEIKMIEWFISK